MLTLTPVLGAPLAQNRTELAIISSWLARHSDFIYVIYVHVRGVKAPLGRFVRFCECKQGESGAHGASVEL